MTPEEFERPKQGVTRHLREMRALKQQYREARRKRGLLDALRGLTNPEAEATHEEMLDRLTRQNVESEARFEVALEDAGLDEDAAARRAREEADREAVRKAEAEALVRDRKSTRLNSSHVKISYAVFCLKKKTIYKRSLFSECVFGLLL